eukprot:TRINITY_DN389_c0_g1_i1.p1 TRINITY_DN389_c0_g1~~TRINITY_DN389_c0_g1_i1.p1  ORF type:complete len:192 (-),score=70.67 TRINITY_DN389_c0_g1_i1:81-611(-)
MKFLLAALVLVAGARAQDTYNCPDGWLLEEDRSGCRCFMFSGGESVTRDDADILCAFHDSWVAELDHPGINYWLKAELLKMTEPGDFNQFWLGAKTTGRHDPDHDQGEWSWQHRNETVEWFDWANGQPNDWHNENCLVLAEYHNPLFPSRRDYLWNDYFCDGASAHYICEKKCAVL